MTAYNFSAVSPQDLRKCCLNKIPYATRTAARDAAVTIGKRIGHTMTPYRCLVCREFHLTHHPAASKPAIKNRLRNNKELK
jgi:hypothetical protein